MTADVLLAVSHGTASARGAAAVAGLVSAVAERLPDVDVRLAHVDVQEPSVQAALADIPEEARTTIVPLLLGAGYHVRVDLRDALAQSPTARLRGVLGPDARLAALLAARVRDLVPGTAGPVVLATAGSSDPAPLAAAEEVARLLADELGQSVRVGCLAGEPSLEDVVADAAPTIVASYLLAPGYFQNELVHRAGGLPVTGPLLDADTVPAPELVDLVIDRFTGMDPVQILPSVTCGVSP